MYGIPEFRLPKDIVRKEIAALKDLGVEMVVNVRKDTLKKFNASFFLIFIMLRL